MHALSDLSSSCKDLCTALSDNRYCLLADALRMVAEWLHERDRYQRSMTSSVVELDDVFSRLPPILDEDDAGAAAAFAEALRHEVSIVVERVRTG